MWTPHDQTLAGPGIESFSEIRNTVICHCEDLLCVCSPHLAKQVTPLPPDVVTALHMHSGPAEGTPEHDALTKKHGFAYRTLLGELLHVYITSHPDISYATISLSKFSTCPHDTHLTMLKKVAKHLHATRDWGIV